MQGQRRESEALSYMGQIGVNSLLRNQDAEAGNLESQFCLSIETLFSCFLPEHLNNIWYNMGFTWGFLASF